MEYVRIKLDFQSVDLAVDDSWRLFRDVAYFDAQGTHYHLGQGINCKAEDEKIETAATKVKAMEEPLRVTSLFAETVQGWVTPLMVKRHLLTGTSGIRILGADCAASQGYGTPLMVKSHLLIRIPPGPGTE